MKKISSNEKEEMKETNEEKIETIKMIILFLIVGFFIICLVQSTISETKEIYSYRVGYTSYGKANLKEAANSHEFGEVFNSGFELKEDYVMAFEKVVEMPSPCKRQYFVTYVDPGISLENVVSNNISWQYALIQQTSATKDLTISEFVKLANSGSQDLLYGGFVKDTSYQEWCWNDLEPDQKTLIEKVSENQIFGHPVEIKKPGKIISITKLHNIPSKCPEQTLVTYYEKTPNGYKNKKILVQGSFSEYNVDTQAIYGGI